MKNPTHPKPNPSKTEKVNPAAHKPAPATPVRKPETAKSGQSRTTEPTKGTTRPGKR